MAHTLPEQPSPELVVTTSEGVVEGVTEGVVPNQIQNVEVNLNNELTGVRSRVQVRLLRFYTQNTYGNCHVGRICFSVFCRDCSRDNNYSHENDQNGLSDSLFDPWLSYLHKKIIFIYNYIYVIFNTITCHVTALMKYYFII